MGRAIFLGKEGVLYKKPKVEEDFEQYKILPDIPENLTLLGNMGFSLVMIGNARNDESGASYRGAHDRMLDALTHMTPSPIVFGTCYHGTEKCECRLPKSKLFIDIIEEYDFDLEDSYMIAGYPSQFNAAKKAGIKNIIIVITGNKKWSATAQGFAIAKVASFSKAVGVIQEMAAMELVL